MKFVSIGEAMVEMSPASDTQFQKSFAGDTYNTAWYLAQIKPDWSVTYCTSVGQDALSDEFVAMAAAAGIDTSLISRHRDRTLGLYLIELNDGERAFHYWRSHSAARTLADRIDTLRAAFHDADVLFFSGITIAILPPEKRDQLLMCLAERRDRGCRVVFDPNLRPRLWPDTATLCAQTMKAAAIAHLVLPSFDEEALYFGDADPAATIARYAEQGSRGVVVKNGAGEIRASVDGDVVSFAPDPVAKVVDTTAAGDSFNAGFLARHLAGEALEHSLAGACALSGKVVQARGALCPI